MRRIGGDCIDLGRGVARRHVTPRGVAARPQIHVQHAGTTARQADPYDEAFLKQYDPALRAINAHRQAVKIHIEAACVEFCIRGQRDEGGLRAA